MKRKIFSVIMTCSFIFTSLLTSIPVHAYDSIVESNEILDESEPITTDELSEILGLEPNKIYITADYLKYLKSSDFEEADIELDEYSLNNPNLTLDELNQKAADILINKSNQNKNTYSTYKYLPESFYDLNPEEVLLVGLYPKHALGVYSCSTKALSESQRLYNNNSATLVDGNGDAFRHAYWNVLMVKDFIGLELTIGRATSVAQLFADAHETASSGTPKEMDLYNNMVGRNIATEQYEGWFSFPSDSSLSSTVLQEVKNGRMRRISKVDGKIYATDSRLDW